MRSLTKIKNLRKRGVGGVNVRIKGVHVRGKEEVKGIWKSHFQLDQREDRKESNNVEHRYTSRLTVHELAERN